MYTGNTVPLVSKLLLILLFAPVEVLMTDLTIA